MQKTVIISKILAADYIRSMELQGYRLLIQKDIPDTPNTKNKVEIQFEQDEQSIQKGVAMLQALPAPKWFWKWSYPVRFLFVLFLWPLGVPVWLYGKFQKYSKLIRVGALAAWIILVLIVFSNSYGKNKYVKENKIANDQASNQNISVTPKTEAELISEKTAADQKAKDDAAKTAQIKQAEIDKNTEPTDLNKRLQWHIDKTFDGYAKVDDLTKGFVSLSLDYTNQTFWDGKALAVKATHDCIEFAKKIQNFTQDKEYQCNVSSKLTDSFGKENVKIVYTLTVFQPDWEKYDFNNLKGKYLNTFASNEGSVIYLSPALQVKLQDVIIL